jgi:CheY-like chemotaxis protein
MATLRRPDSTTTLYGIQRGPSLALSTALCSPTPRIRIVALTAHATSADYQECLAAGLDAYLSKPVGREALYAAESDVPATDPARGDSAA